MCYQAFSLNGDWEMSYRETIYTGRNNPWETGSLIENAVPGYWEDMTDAFAQTDFYISLKINPEYGIQRYPISKAVPDMALPNISGCFFYRRSFHWETVSGAQVIHFSGVQNAVSLWLNDVYLGRHEGYSAPFDIKIPSGVLHDGENIIVLSVSNIGLTGFNDEMVSGLTNRAVNQYTGGITGDVTLRVYPTALRDVAVLISSDCKNAEVRILADGEVAFTWAVSDGNTVLSSGTNNGDFSVDTRNMEKWRPENPKRYTLHVTCGDIEICRPFGVRRLTVDGVHFRLNEKPYYLRGVCEHCYYPETIHPSHDISYYRKIVTTFKRLGFNFIRFHTYVPAEEYMCAADELGILVQVESPNNASTEEWAQIVTFCRRHPSVVIYCCGNERNIDDQYTEHLRICAKTVHTQTDSLFSPLSALRLLEYAFREEDKPELTEIPFLHHPRRFREVGEFVDLYNSYTLGYTSYFSLAADPEMLDSWSDIYQKPRISHEIGIQGTYTDLSLKDRYEGNRIGQTEMFRSIERHLASKALLHRAPLYFKNSCQWQRRLRKHNFETTRLCKKLAGYDYLGPIDTHWHTFGYDVGMMNEFYMLKPGETVRNVRMYNSDTVLLTDMGTNFNFLAGDMLDINLFASCYGEEAFTAPEVNIRLTISDMCIARRRFLAENISPGSVTQLYNLRLVLPEVDEPEAMRLYVTLETGDTFAENEWALYLFPKAKGVDGGNLVVCDGMQPEALVQALEQGKDVLLLGAEPFNALPTSFQIALAGRTSGNLATVIADHPLMKNFPHEGFCGWQFRHLLEGGSAVCFESDEVPFDPIVEVVSSHKYAIRQGALFEFRLLHGRLLVCSFHFDQADPAAMWLKDHLIQYACSEEFTPKHSLDAQQLQALITGKVIAAGANTNFASNRNDKATAGK